MKRVLLLVGCLLIAGIYFVLQKNNSVKIMRQQQEDTTAIKVEQSTEMPSQEKEKILLAVTPKKVLPKDRNLKNDFDLSRYPLETQEKIKTLNEILISKNDNDKRLDTDLKNLSSEDKIALKDFYQDLKNESLNEKGSVVFLLGRNLKNSDDIDFFKNILSEEPCLSMDNCAVRSVTNDPDMSSVDEISLSYPQQVAMQALTQWASKNSNKMDSNLRQHLDETLRQAQRSPIVSIQRKANALLHSLRQ